MEHKIEFDSECDFCHGSGIYQGMAEMDGFGVVCHTCDGTGKFHRVIKYRDFEGKVVKVGVKRVLEANPGIGVDVNEEKGLTLESFGGMPYHEWLGGKPFPPRSEMRLFTCPAWWYQSADYDKKPSWDWCRDGRGFGAFSACDHFQHKEKCWERFDKENLQRAGGYVTKSKIRG